MIVASILLCYATASSIISTDGQLAPAVPPSPLPKLQPTSLHHRPPPQIARLSSKGEAAGSEEQAEPHRTAALRTEVRSRVAGAAA